MSLRQVFFSLATAASIVCAQNKADLTGLGTNIDFKTVDVVVVGGGGSGAHAALRLKDAHKSYVLVERLGQLGGHVNSYTDPTSGRPYDYGVAAYTNYTGVIEFFSRIGIETASPTNLLLNTTYADFTTGAVVQHDPPADFGFGALQTFYSLCQKYENLILPSYEKFPTTSSAIPEDLILPFNQFVAKYHIEDAVPIIYEITGMGMGDMMNALTMYVMATFGRPLTASVLGIVGSFVPATHRNQDIYDRIASILGKDVLYNTTVKSALRSPLGVTITTQSSATGKVTIIAAKKLLMAIEPTPENMKPFNLDATESGLFSKASWSTVQAGIVYHPSLPVNGSLTNLPASSAPNNYTDYAMTPFVGRFDYIGDQNWAVLAMGPGGQSTSDGQAVANKALRALAAAGTIPATNEDLTIKAWSNHGGLSMRTSAANVKAGFITQQKALQNHRSTFWTGGAFSTQLSTTLWAYNDEYLLPKLLASL